MRQSPDATGSSAANPRQAMTNASFLGSKHVNHHVENVFSCSKPADRVQARNVPSNEAATVPSASAIPTSSFANWSRRVVGRLSYITCPHCDPLKEIRDHGISRKSHMEWSHRELYQSYYGAPAPEPSKLRCDERDCNARFTSKYRLPEHKLEVHGIEEG